MAEDSKFPYFLLGLGVGFVAGVLVAPRSGEETIQYLKEKAGEGKEYLHKQQETLKFYRTMDRNLNYRYSKLVNIAISRYFFEWAEEYKSRGDRERMKECLKTSLAGKVLNPFIPKKKLLRMWLGR